MFNTHLNCIAEFPAFLRDKIYVNNNVAPDDTLLMTATALLYQRVENLKLTFEVFNNKEVENINLNPEVYSFHWFNNVGNPDELLNLVKNNFTSIEKLSTHEKFLSEQLKMPIFIRLMPAENTVCIFTSEMSYKAWHSFQFFIPKYFRIFKEKPLNKEEISFLETLTFKTSSLYEARLRELLDTDSFRKYILKDRLEQFERKLFEAKVQAAKNNLASLENEMNAAMEAYRKACEKRIEAIALVSGLQSMADQTEEHTELQDYLLNNQRLCNVTLDNSTISYIVKTYLAPHHIGEWEMITKHIQYFDQYLTSKFTRTEIKLLLDAIFSENRCLKVKMCAYFSLDYFGSKVTSAYKYNFANVNKTLMNYIPNPHLHYHNCFGQNKEAILEQLKCGDAIGAIECSVACAQRVNIHENLSFGPFVRDLLSCSGKCLVTEDGTELTPEEAVAYLKGQDNE